MTNYIMIQSKAFKYDMFVIASYILIICLTQTHVSTFHVNIAHMTLIPSMNTMIYMSHSIVSSIVMSNKITIGKKVFF